MKGALGFCLAVALCIVAGQSWLTSAADEQLSLIYVSPAAGARHISPQTSLAIRQGSPLDPQTARAEFFAVTGSVSGRHTGSVRLSDDALTMLFYPDQPFALNETVSVVVRPGLATAAGRAITGVSYQFSTLDRPISQLAAPLAGDDPVQANPAQQPALAAASPYKTYPEFANIMTTTVTTPAAGVGDGYIFLSDLAFFFPTNPSVVIVDNSGEPIYIKQIAGGYTSADFKRQTVGGVDYLTHYQGISDMGWASGTYYVMDKSYTVVDSWTIGNGYGADEHELQLMDNGHALMFSYTPIPVDLSPYGGPITGTVMDIVIQEQDTAKNVIFEWHASQHIPLIDSFAALDQSPVDFMHSNALEMDSDGNVLVSSRHLSEITKINRQTGNIIWRMGGKRNHFTFTNDDGFSFQHDIRRLTNGHLTLFDNGNQRGPQYSRAVEYAIDESAKTVTRVWQYPDDQSIFSAFMGNVQRLSNGNSFIGWGGVTKVTEVTPAGVKAFEMALGAFDYRSFRFTWDAAPADAPRAALRYSGDPTTATIYSAWNGATDISGYEIYAGPTIAAMTLVTTTARSGFETVTTLDGLDAATCVFRVHPLSAVGATTPSSNSVYRLDQPACRALQTFYYFPSIVR